MTVAAALERLQALVRDVAEAWAVPGLAVAVTDSERTLGFAVHGCADVAAGDPVTPATLFQIGSISKSFAAFAVMHEVEAGRLDLHRPVTEHLPWLPLPALGEPVTNDRGRVPDARDYAGTYRSSEGELVVHAHGERLSLVRDGASAQLERVEPDVFYPVAAEPARYFVRFGRADGRIVDLVDGPAWYAGERYDGPLDFDVPAEWHAYPGVYENFSPWVPGFRVLLRKGQLVVLAPPGVEAPLEPLGDGFRLAAGDETLPARIEFGDVVDGRAARATCDGADLYRVFSGG